MELNKRPITFKDWRALWHYEAKVLGWCIMSNFDGKKLKITRNTWKQILKLKRIDARLNLENQVMDSSWCDAMIELLRPIKK